MPSHQDLDFWGPPPPPSTVDLTSSSEQGTQRPLPKGFDVQEGFIPDAHGDHLLHSELWGTEALLPTSLCSSALALALSWSKLPLGFFLALTPSSGVSLTLPVDC